MFPCLTSHMCGAIASCHHPDGLLPVSFVFFRCLMGHTLPSRGTPLLDKVEKLSQTAIRRDSNTHMETFGDHSDIFYPEFSFHMKHMRYFSRTMNNYMVSLKYDFEEFQPKHCLYTDTSADISNETPVISNIDPELHFYMSKLLIRVRWIIKESKNPYTDFSQTKSLVNYLIKPRDACLCLDTMYYNNTMNIHGCVRTFKHPLQNDTWSYYTLHLLMDVYNIQSLAENNKHCMNESVLDYMMPNVYRLFLNITI